MLRQEGEHEFKVSPHKGRRKPEALPPEGKCEGNKSPLEALLQKGKHEYTRVLPPESRHKRSTTL